MTNCCGDIVAKYEILESGPICRAFWPIQSARLLGCVAQCKMKGSFPSLHHARCMHRILHTYTTGSVCRSAGLFGGLMVLLLWAGVVRSKMIGSGRSSTRYICIYVGLFCRFMGLFCKLNCSCVEEMIESGRSSIWDICICRALLRIYRALRRIYRALFVGEIHQVRYD